MLFNYFLQADTTAVVNESSDDILVAILLMLIIAYFVAKKMIKKEIKKRALIRDQAALQQIAEKWRDYPFFRLKGISFSGEMYSGWYKCRLIAQKNNKFDPYAIEVYNDLIGHMGWIPKGNVFLHNIVRKRKGVEVFVEVDIYNDEDGDVRRYGKTYISPEYFSKEDMGMFIDLEEN